MTEHLCHRPGCTVSVPPKMFACQWHWIGLPKPIRDAIWAAYRPGQERSKRPSAEYLVAARQALDYWSQP